MRFDNESDFKKLAYEAVVHLQNYEANYVKAWKLICEVSSRGRSSALTRSYAPNNTLQLTHQGWGSFTLSISFDYTDLQLGYCTCLSVDSFEHSCIYIYIEA